MTYNPNKYYQAYSYSSNTIQHTMQKAIKKLLVILKHNFSLSKLLMFLFVISLVIDFDAYKSKNQISFDAIPYINKISAKVHMDFNPFNDSKKINSLYSQKIIDNDFLISPKGLKNIEKKFAVKNTENMISFPKIKLSDSKIDIIKISGTKVPNLLQIPSSDWKNNFTKKKIKFIETLLPLISYQNQKIVFERDRLFEIYDYLGMYKTLQKNDIIFLENMAKKYLISSKNKHKIDLVEELLQSVDIIPISIVLAQAATESGWGSSRFAKEYNALFGQYTYDEKNGVVPFKRDEGENYLIRHFTSIDKSVESYFKNINTHYAYEKFRQIRSKMNKNNMGLNFKLLTQHLDVYAEDEFYVETINSIIETNNFMQFDLTNQSFVSS